MSEYQPGSDPARSAQQDLALFFFWLGNAQNEILRHTYLCGRKEGAYDMALVALEARFDLADDGMKALLWYADTETRRDFVCFLRTYKNLEEARAWLKSSVNLDEREPEQPRRWVRRTPGDLYQIILDKMLEDYTQTEWTDHLASHARTLIALLHKDVEEDLLEALNHTDADTLEDIIFNLNKYHLQKIRALVGLNPAASSDAASDASPD